MLGYSITSSPLVVKDKVIVGVSGGEFGAPGFLDAYDAATGKRVWRWHSIPGPGEFGNKSWAEDSWKYGAGPMWLTGSYDPDLNTLYWGVDSNGRPIQVAGSNSSAEGSFYVYPTVGGATNFQAPSYSPITGWFYLEYAESGQQYVSSPAQYEAGRQFIGRGRTTTPAAP